VTVKVNIAAVSSVQCKAHHKTNIEEFAEDECIETSKAQYAVRTCKTLRLTCASRPLYQTVTSAGSLAVILQPAFVPFCVAVDYLL
jgi:hypothetical protein